MEIKCVANPEKQFCFREPLRFLSSQLVKCIYRHELNSGFPVNLIRGHGLKDLLHHAIGALNTQYPNVDYGVTFLPGKDGGWSSFAGGDNFVVTKGTTKLAVVKEFLDFAYSLEGQTILAKYGSLPVRGDIAKEALKDLDPRYQIAAEAMAKGRTPYSVVFNDLINSANGPWTQMVNEVFFGDDVDGAIANAQETMQSIIDQAPQK